MQLHLKRSNLCDKCKLMCIALQIHEGFHYPRYAAKNIVKDCAYVMCFLVYRRRDTVQRPEQVNVSTNMFTSHTYQDMLRAYARMSF